MWSHAHRLLSCAVKVLPINFATLTSLLAALILVNHRVLVQSQFVYPRHHLHQPHHQPQPKRYSLYTYRTARSDDASFDQPSVRYPSQTYYSGSGSSSANMANTPYVHLQSGQSTPSVTTRSYLPPQSSPTVVKHPSTCSYDRSHTACTFSLLCYLANGVPVEGCEENLSMTCCYLQANVAHGRSVSNKAESLVMPVKYTHYTTSPTTDTSGSSLTSLKPTVSSVHSPSNYQTSSLYSSVNSISNYYLPNSKYRMSSYNVPLLPSDSTSASTTTKMSFEPGYLDYKLKKHILGPYESKSYTGSLSTSDMDYGNNAIRRTRTDNIRSIFQEIANRKLYARNYDMEDICGKPMAKPRSRIIGGQDAYFGEFPWQVHIKITKHQCGGALINSQYIVTAAHCIYQAPIQQLNVIIGAHDIEDHRFQDIPPQYFGVSKVILHPNFRFSASHPDRYDIALIKLDSPVRFSDSVLPVCLPEENFQFEGWKGVVTGWGKTDPALSNRYGTRLLQKVDVPIIDNEKCESWHQTRGIDLRIFSEMMCAGYEDGQKDACVGDSGGPLVINVNGRWTLAGITSAGFGCAQSRQPGIYHRVSHTVEWIKSVANSDTTELSHQS